MISIVDWNIIVLLFHPAGEDPSSPSQTVPLVIRRPEEPRGTSKTSIRNLILHPEAVTPFLFQDSESSTRPAFDLRFKNNPGFRIQDPGQRLYVFMY